jgi:carboxylesterase type B
MNGDFQIVAPMVLTARAATKVTTVYMYRFSRVAPSNRSVWGGAAHNTEVPYVFDNTIGDASQSDRTRKVLRWTSFGEPLRRCAGNNPGPTT